MRALGAQIEAKLVKRRAELLTWAEEVDIEIRELTLDMEHIRDHATGEIRERCDRTAQVLEHMRRLWVRHIKSELAPSGPRRVTPPELHAQIVRSRAS